MTGPYERLIADYRAGGVHPFPADGKRPRVSKWNKGRPSAATTQRWAEQFPTANLGLPTARERLAVPDADDPDSLARFEAILDPTPLRVRTRRGEHWYYADPTGERAGVKHPGGAGFDVQGAGQGDYILLPGSEHADGVYSLVDYEGDAPITEFLYRLRRLPRLSERAYSDLVERPRGQVQGVRRPGEPAIVLAGAAILEGTRNPTLFQIACRDAHAIRRRHGDVDQGLLALADQLAGVNATLCVPPLDDAEVDKVARSAWARTVSGVNRPPPPRDHHIRGVLRLLGRDVRSLFLWGWLSQSRFDLDDLDLSPARLALAVPGWKLHDAKAAIKGLVDRKILRLVTAGGKGRGNVPRYRLADLLISTVSFTGAFNALGSDASALALLAFMVGVWGADASAAPISAEGMSLRVGGPFGGWTRARIVKARDRLQAVGLIERLPEKRRGLHRPRALFQVRAAAVLKMVEIVPIDIHRPPTEPALQAEL